MLDDWERTGGTLEAFARTRGLVPQRIAWWRNRLRNQRLAAPAAMTFVQATVLGVNPAAPAAVSARGEGAPDDDANADGPDELDEAVVDRTGRCAHSRGAELTLDIDARGGPGHHLRPTTNSCSCSPTAS